MTRSRRPAALEFSAEQHGRDRDRRETSSTARRLLYVHRSHECRNRRRDRAAKGRTHPDAESAAGARRSKTAEEGTYRVEVYLSSAPGIRRFRGSSAIPSTFGRSGGECDAVGHLREPPAMTRGIQGGPWHVEKDDESSAAVTQKDSSDRTCRVRAIVSRAGSALGSTRRWALAVGKALTERTHLAFRAHGVAAHARVRAGPPSASGDRWQRSIYLDAEPRDVDRSFCRDDSRSDRARTFDPALADTLLFVVTRRTRCRARREVHVGESCGVER